jgi:hypothetical protein
MTMTPLRLRMIDAMVLRGFAARTQETYLIAVGQMAHCHHCSPELLSDEQIQVYLLYLLQERHRSRSTVNITSCAMRFLVCEVLGQTERRPQTPLGRTPQRRSRARGPWGGPPSWRVPCMAFERDAQSELNLIHLRDKVSRRRTVRKNESPEEVGGRFCGAGRGSTDVDPCRHHARASVCEVGTSCLRSAAGAGAAETTNGSASGACRAFSRRG